MIQSEGAMIYFVIILVVLSIGASLINLLPNKRERMQAKLRTEAISEGLSVKVVWPDSIEWLQRKKFNSPLLQYSLPNISKKHHCWRYVGGGIMSTPELASDVELLDEGELSKALAVSLGENFIALERTSAALLLYWLETDIVTLPEVIVQLNAIAELGS